MTALLRQMADDLRAIRRLVERDDERADFRRIVTGLVARGVITPADADKALGRIETEGEGKDE